MPETIETLAHTTHDGVLNLSVNVGVPDSDFAVTVHVRRVTPAENLDANGWPIGYFEQVVGSMPELERAPEGHFEIRLPLE